MTCALGKRPPDLLRPLHLTIVSRFRQHDRILPTSPRKPAPAWWTSCGPLGVADPARSATSVSPFRPEAAGRLRVRRFGLSGLPSDIQEPPQARGATPSRLKEACGVADDPPFMTSCASCPATANLRWQPSRSERNIPILTKPSVPNCSLANSAASAFSICALPSPVCRTPPLAVLRHGQAFSEASYISPGSRSSRTSRRRPANLPMT
jgi:hypothetical protein